MVKKVVLPVIWLLLAPAFLSFVFPVGLYPYQDMFRDVLAFSSGILLLCHVLWSKSIRFSWPNIAIFFPVFFLALAINNSVSDSAANFSFNWYLLSFLFMALIAFSVSSYAETHSRESLVKFLAVFLVVTFTVAAVLGLARFYGILGYLVSLVTEDGSRLIGPMGQPNLMAIFGAIALSGMLFLYRTEQFRSSYTFFSLIVLTFYVGCLTGSRSWYVAATIALWPVLRQVWSGARVFFARDVAAPSGKMSTPMSVGVLFLFIGVSILAPKLDDLIADPLIDSGFLERSNASEMYEKRHLMATSGRLDEWAGVLTNLDIMDHPWLGYGVGRYGVFSNKVALATNKETNGQIWNNAHNIILNIFVEWGLFGLLIFLSFSFYLLFLLFRTNSTNEGGFLKTLVIIFIFHNLVEFSLWYLPFLGIFIASVVLLDKFRPFYFSSSWLPRAIVIGLLAVFVPLGGYVGKDMVKVTLIMYKQTPDFLDQLALRDVGRSSIVGDGALSVLILRFGPPAHNVQAELSWVESVAEWRPEPLYLLRKATLLAAAGEQDKACQSIRKSIFLYPDTVQSIQDELSYLSTKGDVRPERYFKCIASGVGHWVN